jgi:hypothetical protein
MSKSAAGAAWTAGLGYTRARAKILAELVRSNRPKEGSLGPVPVPFSDVFDFEVKQIRGRRANAYDGPNDSLPPRPPCLTGLSLSGGGIRSATVCLGILQAMEQHDFLRRFDYMSTVSGGGFIGGWWSAWLSRPLFAGLRALPRGVTAEALKDCTGGRASYHAQYGLLTLDAANPEEDCGAMARLSDDPSYRQAVQELVDLVRWKRKHLFPRPEQIEPVREPGYLEPERGRAGGTDAETELSEGGLFAGRDPVHHLRLFSNYLTPRKGLMSADTWRAATFVVRSLVLTWLILLPVLFAVVTAAQLPFLCQSNAAAYLAHVRGEAPQEVRPPAASRSDAPASGVQPALVNLNFATPAPAKAPAGTAAAPSAAPMSPEVAWSRLRYIVLPLAVMLGWLVVQGGLWLILCGSGNGWTGRLASAIGTFSLLVIATSWFGVFTPLGEAVRGRASPLNLLALGVWLGGLVVILPLALRRGPAVGSNSRWVAEVLRNRVHRQMSVLLMWFAFVAVALTFAAFGHAAFEYLFLRAIPNAAAAYVAKAGGILLTLLAVAGSVFTLVKASPLGGGDDAGSGSASALTRLVLRATPLLVLLTLLLVMSWVSVELLAFIVEPHGYLNRLGHLTSGTFSGAVVCLTFAAYELNWVENPAPGEGGAGVEPQRPKRMATLIAFSTAAGWAGAAVSKELGLVGLFTLTVLPTLVLTAACAMLVVGRSGVLGQSGERARRKRVTQAVAIAAACAVAGVVVHLLLRAWVLPLFPLSLGVYWTPSRFLLVSATLDGLALSLAVFWIAQYYRDPRVQGETVPMTTLRSRGLAAGVAAGFAVLLFFGWWGIYHPAHMPVTALYACTCVVAASLAGVVALGWMADPNAISMHQFYKSRLVRAYLGASNALRCAAGRDISELAECDDLPLAALGNCAHGAPYHLVGTTLNLVGGKDLVTAQRCSASFVLSGGYCGSTRTGYQPTALYMGGAMTLGTAVAASGAAASPTMGSITPTAAMSMLMTLFNIRLGYWAPTPHRAYATRSGARLWPYYTLREFLSNTNDLGPYCYLTDGGHFDNTGLYNLVQRGCQFILLVDCGADPHSRFEDVGDAIRRCRIDFKAEIDLDVDAFARDHATGHARQHMVVGRVTYSGEHLASLGYGVAECGERKEGTIVWFKPAVTGRDESADVRQYAIGNRDFPQQSTADQWFDEAQFESYRRLAYEAFNDVLERSKDAAPAPDEKKGPLPADLLKFVAAVKARPESGRAGQVVVSKAAVVTDGGAATIPPSAAGNVYVVGAGGLGSDDDLFVAREARPPGVTTPRNASEET